MKYNEPEKWRFMKLDYQRRNDLLQHPELKLPNAEKAMATDENLKSICLEARIRKDWQRERLFLIDLDMMLRIGTS